MGEKRRAKEDIARQPLEGSADLEDTGKEDWRCWNAGDYAFLHAWCHSRLAAAPVCAGSRTVQTCGAGCGQRGNAHHEAKENVGKGRAGCRRKGAWNATEKGLTSPCLWYGTHLQYDHIVNPHKAESTRCLVGVYNMIIL